MGHLVFFLNYTTFRPLTVLLSSGFITYVFILTTEVEQALTQNKTTGKAKCIYTYVTPTMIVFENRWYKTHVSTSRIKSNSPWRKRLQKRHREVYSSFGVPYRD